MTAREIIKNTVPDTSVLRECCPAQLTHGRLRPGDRCLHLPWAIVLALTCLFPCRVCVWPASLRVTGMAGQWALGGAVRAVRPPHTGLLHAHLPLHRRIPVLDVAGPNLPSAFSVLWSCESPRVCGYPVLWAPLGTEGAQSSPPFTSLSLNWAPWGPGAKVAAGSRDAKCRSQNRP